MEVEDLPLILPIYLICAVVWAWSVRTQRPRLARILRLSAMFWAIFLGLSYLFLGLTTEHCGGNILYGFGDCGWMPQIAPVVATWLFLGSYAVGAVYAVLLISVGAYLEWRTRHSPPSPDL